MISKEDMEDIEVEYKEEDLILLSEKYNKTLEELDTICRLIQFSKTTLEEYLIAQQKYELKKEAQKNGPPVPQNPKGIPIYEYNFASLLPTIPDITPFRERNIRKSEYVYVLRKMTVYCYRQGGTPRKCSMVDYMFTWTKDWEREAGQIVDSTERFRKIVSVILGTLNDLDLIHRERSTGAGFKKPYIYSFGSKNPWKDVPYINVKRWKKNVTGDSIVIDDLKFLEDDDD
jgi:hypothetical protein